MKKIEKESHSPRIVMVVPTLPPLPIGGAEMQAMKLCRHLLDRGMDVKVITFGKLWHPRRGEFNGVPFTRLRSILNILVDFLTLFKKKKALQPSKIIYDDKKEITTEINSTVGIAMIVRYKLVFINCLSYLYFRRYSFDIIHVHMMEWPAFIAVKIGKLLGKAVLIKDSTMNGIHSLRRYPNGFLKQRSVAQYAYFAAMTKIIRQNLIAGNVPAEKITMIPNGIDITPRRSVTRRWENKVVFIGNLTQQPAKGVDILLGAWKIVIAAFPTAQLEIVGEGDHDAYKKLVGQMSIDRSVSFAGKQKDVTRILLNADVFVLPSRREGMSNALMEAMVHEMPVVVTDISGNQDLVENGISGLMVPPADHVALAIAIKQMLEDPGKARQMGINAYHSIAEKCDIKNVTLSYYNLYHKILGEA